MKHENECHVKCEIFEEKYISEEESPNIKTTVSPNIDRFNGSDFEETVETSDQENDNELRPKRKKRKSLGSRISLKLRLQQYPHLMEFKSRAICKVGIPVLKCISNYYFTILLKSCIFSMVGPNIRQING